MVGALVSINDFSLRPAKGMNDGEVLSTGQHRFRFAQTPHVPHCWEAGLLFEETKGTLLCSDLFHQNGDVEPLTESDVIDRTRQTLIDYQAGPLANYMPYTKHTDGIMQRLATLNPQTLAPMHGSAYVGDGAQAIRDLAVVMREVLG
jgi:flavorubredoxin